MCAADQLESAIVPVTSIDYGHPHKLQIAELTTSFRWSNQYGAVFDAVRTRDDPPRLAPIEETTDDLMWLFGFFVGRRFDRAQSRPQNGGSRWARVTFSMPRDDRARPRLVDVMGSAHARCRARRAR